MGEPGNGFARHRDHASLSTIHHTLKKLSQAHLRQCWVIPPQANSAPWQRCVRSTRGRMILNGCWSAYETPKQLIAKTRLPIPMKAGRPSRVDYEYERNGTADLFMLFAPLETCRHIKMTYRRADIDYAHVLMANVHPFRTISTSTARRRLTKLCRRPKPDGG